MNRQIAPTPKLGIAFLVKGRLFIASSALTDCENWAEFKNYPGGHPRYWVELQRKGLAPLDSEYDEHPRGRVVLNAKTGQFSLYLDRCILRKQKLVRTILSRLHLPANTLIATDPHYRCQKCLGRGTRSTV